MQKNLNDSNIFTRLSYDYKKTISEKKSENFCMIYYDYIKYNHPFWTAFITKNNLNLGMMNMISFFQGIIIDCGFNALFFTNFYIQKRYYNEGIYSFLISFPKCFYSFIVGLVVSILVTTITSSQRNIYNYLMKQKKMKDNQNIMTDNEQKQESISEPEPVPVPELGNQQPKENQIVLHKKIEANSKNNKGNIQPQIQPKKLESTEAFYNEKHKKEYNKIIKVIKIKFAVYFIINYCIICFFWYYTSAFCAVFEYSQIDWLIGCALSIGINFIFPFLLCFLFALVKWISLSCKCINLFIFIEIITQVPKKYYVLKY